MRPEILAMGVGCESSQNDSVWGKAKSLMNKALSRILELFAGYHRRRAQHYPVHPSYCIRGALKPAVVNQKCEVSLKTPSPLRGI